MGVRDDVACKDEESCGRLGILYRFIFKGKWHKFIAVDSKQFGIILDLPGKT